MHMHDSPFARVAMRIAAEFIIMLALIINWADIRGAPRQCQTLVWHMRYSRE